VRLFRIALAVSLTVSALLYFLWSWRWPLVGDASLIHYIVFLAGHGMAPYRDLGDMNMPGSYLVEAAAMRVFGPGDLAWRLFDFTQLGVATASYFVIADRSGAPSMTALSSWVGTMDRPGAPSMTVSPSWVGTTDRSGAPSMTALSSWVGTMDRPGAPSMTALSSWVGTMESRLAALFAASLFILIHGRDGLAQGGQRDLSLAVLLLAATACLFVAVRCSISWGSATFGLLSGIALTIKPTALPVTLALLLIAIVELRRRSRPWLGYAVFAAAGLLVAPAVALVFLVRQHALAAFVAGFHGIVPYYASLGHRPLGYLLLHSLSPLLPVVLLWLALLALCSRQQKKTPFDWERVALLSGAAFGLISYIIQARGLPYYRYPFLAFLLPLIAIDLTRILETPLRETAGIRPRAAFGLAIVALAVGGLFLAPQSALHIHRFRWWDTGLTAALEQDLDAIGGPALSGHVQCIDSVSGCGATLYRMRLVQSTGVLSDFLLFGPDNVPVVRQTRAQFAHVVLTNPPWVIVVTSHLHIDGPERYEKLARWPMFNDLLATRYVLARQWTPPHTVRWWDREELPAGYRIYVLRP